VTCGIDARAEIARHREMGEQQTQQGRDDTPTIHRVEV
jgi:hypothetical protein